MKGRLGQHGYTLPEIVLVLAILALLFGMTVPIVMVVRERLQRGVCYATQSRVEIAYQRLIAEEGSDMAPRLRSFASLILELVPDYYRRRPGCPSGGRYIWFDEKLICTYHGHHP